MASLFDVKHLNVSVGKKTLLDIDNLSLPSGQFVALIGANGAGKSTLLHSFLGNVQNCQVNGTIFCQNQAVGDVIKQGKIAWVGQHEQFNLPLTVLDYALLGTTPKLLWYQTANSKDKQKALDYLAQFELQDLAQKRIQSLSGGEKQRLAIVRALMQNTEILLFDEPSNHLDIKHERLLFAYLQNLVQNEQKSVVVVLHSLSHAYQYASHVVALHKGKVLAAGHPSAVMNDEILSQMYQTKIHRVATESGFLFY
ncbi:ABC transporter-like protein [Moraxella macacae 0408225]|uniref:ABC transporter-like protein n=1 Tax=Moraxella macacae 0408225 TaxID=1230338 RepID=L2FB49_9GAMM|nr:ABC transporter ATP-binding protein [Moraxella macacae]ELA09663.1 ABC transporter-like protein [Moraxella macacae 0408225]